jgi:Amt family ammonium transporter
MIVFFVIKKTIGLRVSDEEQLEGLDIGEHGQEAYPDFVTRAPGGRHSPTPGEHPLH